MIIPWVQNLIETWGKTFLITCQGYYIQLPSATFSAEQNEELNLYYEWQPLGFSLREARVRRV